jgi:hypothetical protein
VKKGENKKRLLGVMGEPVSLSALIGAASAIIASIGKFLKENGIDPEQLLDIGKKVLADKAKQVLVKGEEAQNLEIEETNEILTEAQIIKTGPPTQTGNKNILPIVLIGGAAAYFLLNKRK